MLSRNVWNQWNSFIRERYPDLENRAYFVPPVIINRIQFDEKKFAGQSVLVPLCQSQSPQTTPPCQNQSLQTTPLCQSQSSQSTPPCQNQSLQTTPLCQSQSPQTTPPCQNQSLQTTPPSQNQTSAGTAGRLWTTLQGPPVQVQESDLRDDTAQQRVLFCLQELAKYQKEVMFVISQLNFSDYLNKSCYAAAVQHFMRPEKLPAQYKKGDFDLLLIHRFCGVLVGEIKSVASNPNRLKKSQQDVDTNVGKRVEKAIAQLQKSETVVRELTKDLSPNMKIVKSLILPNVTRTDLMRILTSNKKLEQDLVTCLKAANVTEALDLCLLSDHLTDHQNTWNVQNLQTWWTRRVSAHWDSSATLDLYTNLVARFCGPATTIAIYCVRPPRMEVRTEGEGVSVVGERMTMLVLTYQQVDLLTRAPPRVMLTGGPGVGKSVMLALMALEWLRSGCDVQVVSSRQGSIAASRMLKHVIDETIRADATAPPSTGSVHLHEFEFGLRESDVDKAISTLSTGAGFKGPFIILDEFWTSERYSDPPKRFVSELYNLFPHVYIWGASMLYNHIPAELTEEKFTTPLRYPATVLLEVEKGVNWLSREIYPYTTQGLVSPCEGLSVIRRTHLGSEHTVRWPVDCQACGRQVAEVLQQLGVGRKGQNLMNTTPTSSSTSVQPVSGTSNSSRVINRTTVTCPPPLQYRDVFVLSRCLDFHDDVVDEDGRVVSRANGVVLGLREAGVPVHVISKESVSSDVCDTAVARDDVVTVSDYQHVPGLERKVVVWLYYENEAVDGKFTAEEIEANDRLQAAARCMSQLVVVEAPRT